MHVVQRICNIQVRRNTNSSELRTAILESSIAKVSSLGWSEECIAKTVVELGLPPLSHTIIHRGSSEMVEFFMDKKREHAMAKMNSTVFPEGENVESIDRKNQKLVSYIEGHLEYIYPIKKTWPEAMAITLNPEEIKYSMRYVMDITNDLCEISNIRAARLDWYTERAILGALFLTTELFFLTDDSENFVETK